MLTKSCKAKARRLQDQICDDLKDAFRLSDADIRPAIMGERGCDVHLSEAARKLVPFALEAKATESLQIWASIKQAEDNATKEKLRPALVFKRNRSKMYVCLGWQDFLLLLEYMAIANHDLDEGLGRWRTQNEFR
jgi:hypothetical protein